MSSITHNARQMVIREQMPYTEKTLRGIISGEGYSHTVDQAGFDMMLSSYNVHFMCHNKRWRSILSSEENANGVWVRAASITHSLWTIALAEKEFGFSVQTRRWKGTSGVLYHSSEQAALVALKQ